MAAACAGNNDERDLVFVIFHDAPIVAPTRPAAAQGDPQDEPCVSVTFGGRLVKHARYYWLLLAEGHLNRRRFGAMLGRIALLPVPTG
jgi:hypothetical protein